jgi:hypothetical protein
MRREVNTLFTESSNKLKALIYVFGRVSVLYSNIVIGGDNKHTAAAAVSNSQPTRTKLTACGGDGGSGGSGSKIWSIVFFEKVLLPHIIKKLPKFHGYHTFINEQST